MLNPHLLFDKQDGEGATSPELYFTPGERDNKQVDVSIECGKWNQGSTQRADQVRREGATSDG